MSGNSPRMDVNAYYQLMGQHSAEDNWHMPKYNGTDNKPLLGQVRKAVPTSTGKFKSGQGRIESNVGIGEGRRIHTSARFEVTLGAPIPGAGVLTAAFSRVSGLVSTWDVEEYREGGYNDGEHLFPTRIKNEHVVLENGTGTIEPLLQWYMLTQTGVFVRIPMTIMLKDSSNKIVKAWMLLDAMPIKYVGPTFDAMQAEVAITKIEMAHSGIITV